MGNKTSNDTEKVRRRYDRIAFVFNLMEWPMEKLRFEGWRKRLRRSIVGPRVLEVGVGTGKNMPHYPADISVTAIDFSSGMLARARRKARRLNKSMDLLQMDVQQLDFADGVFDTVFATFVFCSVPDPVQGLCELRRVCKAGGRLVLLEHMRPDNRLLGLIFDALNPLTVRLTGANINRRTVKNVKRAGWRLLSVEDLSLDIVRWIEAQP